MGDALHAHALGQLAVALEDLRGQTTLHEWFYWAYKMMSPGSKMNAERAELALR